MFTNKPTLLRHGFTLVELLAVIAIVGILAAILIPVIGKVRESASCATLVSNYRQIGAAMNLYCSDNRGQLPGIRNGDTSYDLLGGQMPYRTSQSSQDRTALQGMNQLGPYIASQQIPVGNVSYYYTPVLSCPKIQSEYTLQQLVTLKCDLLDKTPSVDGTSSNLIYPFGLASATQNARTLTQVINALPVSQRWLMHDYDPNHNNNPIHGSNYVTLFYDGHVELVPQAKMGANGLIL